MLEYVDTKERQGIYFQKSSERIHLPEPAELALKDHSRYGNGEEKLFLTSDLHSVVSPALVPES